MADTTSPPYLGPEPARLRSITAEVVSGTSYMVVGTLVAGIGAYLFQLVGGRVLGPTEFAPVTVLWTLQFLVYTIVLIPIEQITIRRLALGTPVATPWRLFAAVVVATAGGTVLFTAATLDRFFAEDRIYLVISGALMLGYGAYALARGYLAGQLRYREYGLSTLAESALRLAVAVLVLIAGAGAIGLGWSLVLAPLGVFLFRPFREVRSGAVARARGAGAFLGAFIVANAASQTILAAGPLVVGALGAAQAEVSVFFLTFLLFRAPLTLSYSLIARVLPPFTSFVARGELSRIHTWAWRLGAAGLVLAVAGWAVGYLLGPGVVELLLGSEFRPTASLAAVAASGMTLATISLYAQQILIALGQAGRLAAAWIAGLTTAAAVLTLAAGSPSMRVGIGFLVGEAVAFVGLIGAVLGRR
ncbi:MAG: lipopolysaccharide biosynthesis protein [Acidimicrobiia bacterium]